jgi:hypothetical protein
MPYYYADAFEEANGTIAPGKYHEGVLESGIDDIPPGCRTVIYDASLSPARFVLQTHPSWDTPPLGWVSKTVGEINTDYPGLIGD